MEGVGERMQQKKKYWRQKGKQNQVYMLLKESQEKNVVISSDGKNLFFKLQPNLFKRPSL